MVVGTGVDIVEIERFRKLADKQGYVRQILTDNELQRVPDGSHQDVFLATVFAVKEAVLKALGCGLHDGSYWHEVEVDEKWAAWLSGRLAERARQQSVTVVHSSQSCAEDRVVAFVLLENNVKEDTP